METEEKNQKFGLSLRFCGRIFEATVLASLFYGSEIRSFSRPELHRYWVFVGKCIRYLYHRKCRTGVLTQMKEKHLTMTDLRCELGLEDVKWYITQRQCS